MFNFKNCLQLFFLIAVVVFVNSFPIAASAKVCTPHHDHWECVGNCPGELDDWWCYDDETCGPCYVAGSSVGAGWQNCDAGAGAHYCNNNCLKSNPDNFPKNPRWYDDPTKNNDAAADKGNKNDTLPIVLDWEVNSWKGGSNIKWAIPNYGTNSMYIEIDNPDNQLFEPEKVPNATYNATKKILGKCVTNDYFNSIVDGQSCLFRAGKQNITYRVKACCASDCTNCGDFVQWNFSTGEFTEPKSPLDPDWNGPGGATGLDFKGLQLEWCKSWVTNVAPVDWAKSYELMVTSDEQGISQQNCHPLLVTNNQCIATKVFPNASTGDVTTFYPIQGRTDLNFFTRDRTYMWKMKTCFDETSSQCGDYGQTWTFTDKNDPIGIPAATAPANDSQGSTPVGMPLSISWTIPDGANSFIYETSFITGSQNTKWNTIPNNESTAGLKDKFDAPNLKTDTLYKWRVKACSNFNSTNCDAWSAWFTFRTTGRPPKRETMAQTSGIPITFSWEAVPGAKSYNFILTNTGTGTDTASTTISDQGALQSPKYSVNYPGVDQGNAYSWKVQTCAHSDGTVCGAWSDPVIFTVPSLTASQASDPTNGSTVYTEANGTPKSISWYAVPGAAAYHYTVTLISHSANSSSTVNSGTSTVSTSEENCVQNPIEKTVSSSLDMVQLNCLGTYQVSVRPCIDSGCASMGPESKWEFVLAEQIPATRAALQVCGLAYDNPDTPWNDRETCQPKHLLLLGTVMIDFVLFKVSVFLLPILVLITGLIFYSSFNTPETIDKVKNAWKAVGIGYAILILAWIIVCFLLQIMGFPGLWWKIL